MLALILLLPLIAGLCWAWSGLRRLWRAVPRSNRDLVWH
jgi:hypothetical protein